MIALGLLFAPFTSRTVIFIAATAFVLAILPLTSRALARIYGHRTAAIRTMWLILVLFGLGALALWSGSEAVLPAYVVGMVLAEFSATRILMGHVSKFGSVTAKCQVKITVIHRC